MLNLVRGAVSQSSGYSAAGDKTRIVLYNVQYCTVSIEGYCRGWPCPFKFLKPCLLQCPAAVYDIFCSPPPPPPPPPHCSTVPPRGLELRPSSIVQAPLHTPFHHPVSLASRATLSCRVDSDLILVLLLAPPLQSPSRRLARVLHPGVIVYRLCLCLCLCLCLLLGLLFSIVLLHPSRKESLRV